MSTKHDTLFLRYILRVFCTAFVFVGLTAVPGCSPKLPARINAPSVEFPVKAGVTGEMSIFIDAFVDARPKKAIVEYNDQEIAHIQDLGPLVVDGIATALQGQGFSIADTAPVILSGQIRQWSAKVTGGMPSKVDSTAELYVELLDPANKRMYSGVYKGFAAVESPSLDEDEVQTALRASMKQTISQMVADQQLIRLLKTF